MNSELQLTLIHMTNAEETKKLVSSAARFLSIAMKSSSGTVIGISPTIIDYPYFSIYELPNSLKCFNYIFIVEIVFM